jgi:2-oxoglutarate ferredoxin oxidoreductase subunit gamma
MRQEIRIAGFGGQGIISMGILLAVAAGKYEGKEVAQTQSYGPEARGGACKTEVVLADGEIDYIKALNPDFLVVMSQPALDKYVSGIDPEYATLVVDETLVQQVPASIKKLVKVPATKIAEEQLGNRIVANIVMLGVIAKISSFVGLDACKRALIDNMPARTVEKNLQALDKGYNYVNVG